MTPRQRARIDRLHQEAFTCDELAVALVEHLRELCDDRPGGAGADGAVAIARYLSALGHAAALVELCPMPAFDLDVEQTVTK